MISSINTVTKFRINLSRARTQSGHFRSMSMPMSSGSKVSRNISAIVRGMGKEIDALSPEKK
jgi:hypothetical protein